MKKVRATAKATVGASTKKEQILQSLYLHDCRLFIKGLINYKNFKKSTKKIS